MITDYILQVINDDRKTNVCRVGDQRPTWDRRGTWLFPRRVHEEGTWSHSTRQRGGNHSEFSVMGTQVLELIFDRQMYV